MVSIVLSLTAPLVAQPDRERQTTVVPLSGEEILQPCEYRLVIPDQTEAVKAVWVIFDRGKDYLNWYQDGHIREFARKFRLALVLAMHCRSKERQRGLLCGSLLPVLSPIRNLK